MPTIIKHGPFQVSKEMVNTGISIEAGYVIITTSEGILDLGGAFAGIGAPFKDADGDDWTTPSNYPAPALRKNSLIYKVGGQWFQGGVNTAPGLECTTSGELILYVNDAYPNDNSRQWNVWVKIIDPRPSLIDPCYEHLGGIRGFLGRPTSLEGWTMNYIGRFRHFGGGSLYWSPATGCHEVHGDIRTLYEQLGWERGILGYPITNETNTPDSRGRYNHFQNGSIYWSPETGAHEVFGPIRDKYRSLGWEQSFLRFPTSGVISNRWSDFQGGSIYFSHEYGAHVLFGEIRAKWLESHERYGSPTDDQRVGSGDSGQHCDFEAASIYSSRHGTWAVWDRFRVEYRRQGSQNGPLGFPTAANRASNDGRGEYQQFEHGGIYFYGREARRVNEDLSRPLPAEERPGTGTGVTTLILRLAVDSTAGSNVTGIDGERTTWQVGDRRIPAGRLEFGQFVAIMPSTMFTLPVELSISCVAQVQYTGEDGRTVSTIVESLLPNAPGEMRSTDYPIRVPWNGRSNVNVLFTVRRRPGTGAGGDGPKIGFVVSVL